MVIVLIALLSLAPITALGAIKSWKDNDCIQRGRYHRAYCYCVFKLTTFPSSSPASRYCDQQREGHDYLIPMQDDFNSYGYSVTGYFHQCKPEGYFRDFKNTFKRYCYLPADGLNAFYSQYTKLKFFSYIPALCYLVPYWVKGKVVQETVMDTLTGWLDFDYGPGSFSSIDTVYRYPDIPLNILYSDNDPLVTYTDACVIYAQLAKSSATIEMDEGEPVEIKPFPNIRILKVTENNGNYVTEVQNFDPASMPDVIKSYEKRRWWLKNLWVSKLILMAVVSPVLLLLLRYCKSHAVDDELAFCEFFEFILNFLWR